MCGKLHSRPGVSASLRGRGECVKGKPDKSYSIASNMQLFHSVSGVPTCREVNTEDDNRFDANEDVQSAVDDLKNGEYKYVCAWDDIRVARDDYFWEIRRAARLGNAEFEFIDKSLPDGDSLTFAVNRTVEQKVKEREMRKAAEARAYRDYKGTMMVVPSTERATTWTVNILSQTRKATSGRRLYLSSNPEDYISLTANRHRIETFKRPRELVEGR